MSEIASDRVPPAAISQDIARLSWLRLAEIAVLAFVVSISIGWKSVVVAGELSQTDAYQRLNRLIASIEAGRILDHIPRDNAGAIVALHWSHVLEAIIALLALPLLPVFGASQALHFAGATIGPLTLFVTAIAVIGAVRRVTGAAAPPVVLAAITLIGPPVLSYGAFGQADHHLLLAALALAAPALAYARAGAEGTWRSSALGGALGGLGIWASPELVPFVLFGWAVAILSDVEASGRMGIRALSYSGGLLGLLVVAFVIDPPWPAQFAAEPDRLSLPFVALGLLLLVGSLAGRYLAPRLDRVWPGAILGGCIAALSVLPWVIFYPEILRGPSGIFSPEGYARVWTYVGEMRPITSTQMVLGFALFPTIAVVLAVGDLVRRNPAPLSLLVAAMAAVIVAYAWLHVRFSVYLQVAGAASVGCYLALAFTRAGTMRARRIAVLTAMLLGAAPLIGYALAPADLQGTPRGPCSMQRIAPNLASQSGRVVLTELNYAPSLIYFTRSIAVTGPYHRNERLMIAVLDAFAEQQLGDGVPASFKATGAASVLVCTSDRYQAGSLGEALAAGRAPPWLREIAMPADLGFRLFELR